MLVKREKLKKESLNRRHRERPNCTFKMAEEKRFQKFNTRTCSYIDFVGNKFLLKPEKGHLCSDVGVRFYSVRVLKICSLN